MDFTKNQTDKDVRRCLTENFKCRSSPEKIKKITVPENINNLYILNRNILDLTSAFWIKLFEIIRQEKFLGEENVCYDILNPENCDDLNEDYHFFTEELISYQKHYFDKQNHKNYFLLVKKLHYSVLNFLNSPLFSLKNDVEHLIIRIHKPHINDFYIEISTEEDIGIILNRYVHIYLELLEDLIIKFNHTYLPAEINELREYVFERIEAAKIRKMKYLNKNVFNKTATITTTTFPSTINHIDKLTDTFNSIDEGSAEVTQSDTTTLTPEIRSNSNHSLDYTSEYLFETTNEIIISDLNENIIQNIDDSLNHNKTDTLFEQHEREVNVVSTNDWIIFGSVFFVLFLLLFLVYYVIKRYKSGRKRRGKNEFIRFDIIRQIFD